MTHNCNGSGFDDEVLTEHLLSRADLLHLIRRSMQSRDGQFWTALRSSLDGLHFDEGAISIQEETQSIASLEEASICLDTLRNKSALAASLEILASE